MKKGDIIRYRGADGQDHTLEYVEPGFFVSWLKGSSPSQSGRFKLDGGSVIQVPLDALEWSRSMGFIMMIDGPSSHDEAPPPEAA